MQPPVEGKASEIPATRDLSLIMGGSYGQGISMRDQSSKRAGDPVWKDQCD